jgi:hypothetical protein
VRVPILVPAGVLLCAYKLGFGLVQNFLEKFKIPSVWAHRTVQCAPTLRCAMSGALAGRAWICHYAAMSGGSLDSDYALSGVPMMHFKKNPILPKPEARALSQRSCLSSLLALPLWCQACRR